MWNDSLFSRKDALRALKPFSAAFETLIEIGIVTPVGRTAAGEPRFSKNLIARLSTSEQQVRIREALSENFEPRGVRLKSNGKPWAPPTPYYPFDNWEQQVWARKRHRMTARGFRRTSAQEREVEDVKARNEERATTAYRKALRFHPEASVMCRAGKTRKQLHDLVWSKPMAEAGAELDMSESTLRQLCNDYAVPTPPRGHFNHGDHLIANSRLVVIFPA
jgi:hypothetical protein